MIKVCPRLRALPERIRCSPRHVLFSNKNTFLFSSMEFYLQNGRNPISIELLLVFFSPIRLIRADRNRSVLAGGKIWCLNQYRPASTSAPHADWSPLTPASEPITRPPRRLRFSSVRARRTRTDYVLPLEARRKQTGTSKFKKSKITESTSIHWWMKNSWRKPSIDCPVCKLETNPQQQYINIMTLWKSMESYSSYRNNS